MRTKVWPPHHLRLATWGLLGLFGLMASNPGTAADTGASAEGRIYTCVDSNGRRLSSDRPIPECLSQEQRLLGRDGSTRAVVPPLNSREEQERLELRQRQREQELAAQNEAVRRDRTLLSRFPDLAAHDLARQRATATVTKSLESTKARLALLDSEAQALTAERAALGFKVVPEDLKQRTSTNEGTIEAQRNILHNQEVERDRINQQFDLERQRLQWLLAGMPPGTPDDKTPSRRPAPVASSPAR